MTVLNNPASPCPAEPTPAAAAANGLLRRRVFVWGLTSVAGASRLLLAGGASGAALSLLTNSALPRLPGKPMSPYGEPAPGETHVVRQNIRSLAGTTGSGASATPLQHLRGTITPSGLHFERHHSGVPTLDPATHRLVISGAVRRALGFDLDSLHRYPMVTRLAFLECSGNSAGLLASKPLLKDCAGLHGLLSCSEWTGVPLRYLLDEAGITTPDATGWVIAEGADAARMNRSIPLRKCLDDAIIALYQNGERLRPENGYPMRLFLPGYEGNMSIKWLHRLEVSGAPAMSREETAKYTDLQPDGRATGFSFEMGVKSVITSPSPGLNLNARGLYQISGLAWGGAGAIRRVEVSADGGKSWMDAEFEAPPSPFTLTRFGAAWHWQGQPAALMSRATDSAGQIQPARTAWLKNHGSNAFYHYNAIQTWQVLSTGEVQNAYAA